MCCWLCIALFLQACTPCGPGLHRPAGRDRREFTPPVHSTQSTAHSHSSIKCNLSVTVTKNSPWRWSSRVETRRSVLRLMIKLSLCICWWLVFLHRPTSLIYPVCQCRSTSSNELRLVPSVSNYALYKYSECARSSWISCKLFFGICSKTAWNTVQDSEDGVMIQGQRLALYKRPVRVFKTVHSVYVLLVLKQRSLSTTRRRKIEIICIESFTRVPIYFEANTLNTEHLIGLVYFKLFSVQCVPLKVMCLAHRNTSGLFWSFLYILF
jgi:hypothetical protein